MTDMTAESHEAIEQHRTFRVHETRVAEAQALVEKVNKRARRYGLSEYSLVIGEKIMQPVYLPVDAENPWTGNAFDRPIIGYDVLFDVELVGEMPRIDGWSFVATLDYEEVEEDGDGRVITRVVPGVDVDLSAHRVRPNECDHCGKVRYRNNTYVLLNAETGETMQVGSSCIQPYMGLSVNGLAWMAGDIFSEMEEYGNEREGGGYGGRTTRRYDVDTILLFTAGIVSVKGWVSRAASNFEEQATAAIVNNMIDPPSYWKDDDRRKMRALTESINWDEAKETAAKIKAWATAEDGQHGEWRENVRILASGHTVTRSNVGVLASAIAGYRKSISEAIEKAQRAPVDYVGKPKDKVAVVGEVFRIFAGESDWGMYEIIIIRGEGVTYKWKSSRITGLDVGDRVEGVATVKAHEEYREEKQTVITRAKLTKVK